MGLRSAVTAVALVLLGPSFGEVTSGSAQDAVCPPEPGPGPVTFTDATAEAGMVLPLTGMHAHAAAAGDVNGDGRLDLFVGTFADRPPEEYAERGATGPSPDTLLLGSALGATEDASFPEAYGRTSGAAFADLDGDGDRDLVAARHYRNDPQRTNDDLGTILYRNDDGAFTEAALLDATARGRSIGVLDADGDGDLDLFLGQDSLSRDSLLLRNDGMLVFTDVTAASGIPPRVLALGVGIGDLTGDGWPDIVTGGSRPPAPGSFQVARVFVNRGDGTFREADGSAFIWPAHGNEDWAAGVALGDLNRDGRLDVAIGQHYGSTLDHGIAAPVRIYLHQGTTPAGDPRFSEVQDALPGLLTKAPHVEITDLDNDGWPDVVAWASAGGGALPAAFRATGAPGGTPAFEEPEGLGSPQYWPTGVAADMDGDGRVDLFAAEWYPDRPSLLLRNETDVGHWVEVEVSDPVGGVGSRVEIYCAGGLGDASSLIGMEEISVTEGYGAGTPGVARFGLGDVGVVDVRVTPPHGAPPIDRLGVTAGTSPVIEPPPACTTVSDRLEVRARGSLTVTRGPQGLLLAGPGITTPPCSLEGISRIDVTGASRLAVHGTRGGNRIRLDGTTLRFDGLSLDVRGVDRVELRGRGGRDILVGGSSPDLLRGGGGKDRLRGRGGDDRLSGGPRVDTLDGGGGTDRCRQRRDRRIRCER